jgi:hypothetical protein
MRVAWAGAYRETSSPQSRDRMASAKLNEEFNRKMDQALIDELKSGVIDQRKKFYALASSCTRTIPERSVRL